MTPEMKFDCESSSQVRKMLGCSNKKYENFYFIRRRFTTTTPHTIWTLILDTED